jgi:hypothetical protein
MAPVIIAALISAAASKVKSNQANAMKMNEGNKTGGTYQISSGEGNGGQSNAYRPSEQQVNTGGNGGELAKNIIKQYLDKKNNSEAEGVASEVAGETANEAANEAAETAANEAAETAAENVAENIH